MNRHKENLNIKHKALLFDIFLVEQSLFLCRNIVTSVDLRPTGYSRANTVDIIFLTKLSDSCLLRNERTRTYKAHRTVENIQKLRKLINTCCAKNSSEPCYLNISIGKIVAGNVFRSALHCSEFIYFKQLVVFSYAFLAKEHGAAVGNQDADRNNKEQRRKNNQCKKAD